MSDDRPTEEEIRRAIAQLMTLEHLDDAMGWAPGTARRQRWQPPGRGGLPPADAELGGHPLWFRTTFERWLHTNTNTNTDPGDGAAGADTDGVGVGASATSTLADTDATDRQPGDDLDGDDLDGDTADDSPDYDHDGETDNDELNDDLKEVDTEADDEELDTEAGDAEPDTAHAGTGTRVDAELDTATDSGGTEGPPQTALSSGFDLDLGQPVLAHLHGRWTPAEVKRRDRLTVLVEYRVDDSPLGIRQQRITIHQLRIRPTPDPER